MKLWTEDPERLAEKLALRSGEKTSALEGLGRLQRDSLKASGERHGERLNRAREDMMRRRAELAQQRAARERGWEEILRPASLAERLAGRAHRAVHRFDDYLRGVLADHPPAEPEKAPSPTREPEPSRGHDR